MYSRSLIAVFGLMLLILVPTAAAGPTPVTGTATSCSLLATCHYSFTSSAGTGWASTSAFVGGYVGQPVAFSGGSVSFQLPGEAVVSYVTGTYNGQGVVIGYSATAGTLYNMTGTFTGNDANTGTLVSGSTSTVVGIKGHSGRGGGNTYTLVSGSISITVGSMRGSSVSVVCNPSSITVGGKTTCTVTVSDTGSGTPITPSGTITLSSSPHNSGTLKYGHLSVTKCTLSSSGTCSVSFKSGNVGPVTITVAATFNGDSVHVGSTGSGTVSIID